MLLSVLLVFAVPQPPSRLGLGAAVRVGALIPTSRLKTSFVSGLEVRERLPMWRRVLGFSLDLGLSRPTLGGSGDDGAVGGVYSYAVSARALSFGADVLGFLPVAWPVDVYAGFGYAAFVYAVTASAFGTQSTEVETRHGFRARAGVAWPFWGPLYVAAEAAYYFATLGFAITGPSSAGQVALSAQVGFEL